MLSKKCSILKRLSAFLIDVIIILVARFIIEFAFCYPILKNTTTYYQDQERLFVEKVQCHLFVVVDKDYQIIADSSNSEEEIISSYQNRYLLVNLSEYVNKQKDADSSVYLSYLDKFYVDIDNENYQEMKENSGLFLDVEKNIFLESVSENERIEFCNKLLKNADQVIIKYKDGIINSLQANVYVINLTVLCVSYGIPLFIFFYLVPVFSKYKNTIGKKITKLAVVNSFYVPSNALLLLTRFLTIVLIEVLLSLFLIGLPLIGSFVMILLTKNGKSLHDLLATTIVIDLNDFTPFDNLDQYKEFIKKEKEVKERSLRKVYEE